MSPTDYRSANSFGCIDYGVIFNEFYSGPEFMSRGMKCENDERGILKI
jgi:hypothetical protein